MPEYIKCPKCGNWACGRSYYRNELYCFPRLEGCGEIFRSGVIEINGVYAHILPNNKYLTKEIKAFFHDYYIPVGKCQTRFSKDILDIKDCAYPRVMDTMSDIMAKDLDTILRMSPNLLGNRPIALTVPRSKPDSYWEPRQLKFRPTVSMALEKSTCTVSGTDRKWIEDGVHYITRVSKTQTTHLAHIKDRKNEGPAPYVGITHDTCRLNENISHRYVILIDDIYTKNIGIIEDCVQFLLDNGASGVIVYTLGMTRPRYR